MTNMLMWILADSDSDIRTHFSPYLIAEHQVSQVVELTYYHAMLLLVSDTLNKRLASHAHN